MAQRQNSTPDLGSESGMRPASTSDAKIATALARTDADRVRAEAEFRALAEATPGDPWPVLALLELLLQQGRNSEATALVGDVLSQLKSERSGYPDRRERAGMARPDEASP